MNEQKAAIAKQMAETQDFNLKSLFANQITVSANKNGIN